jgi:hypothetical protein
LAVRERRKRVRVLRDRQRREPDECVGAGVVEGEVVEAGLGNEP